MRDGQVVPEWLMIKRYKSVRFSNIPSPAPSILLFPASEIMTYGTLRATNSPMVGGGLRREF